MRSIQALFEKVRTQNPEWSDFICFSEAITNKGFSRDRIGRAFYKLVDKDDCPGSKREVLKFLAGLTQKEHRGVRQLGIVQKSHSFVRTR